MSSPKTGDTVSHVNIFDPAIATLIFSLVHLCQSTVYTDSVWLGWGRVVLSCIGDHILQEFN